jgi:hypothetical protein
MAQKKPWIDPDTNAVAVLRMILLSLDGKERLPPVTLKSLKLAKDIAGIKLAPANKDGIRNWILRPGWEGRLLQAGIDPVTWFLLDAKKFDAAVARIRAEKQEKRICKDKTETRENLQAALKRYSPPKPAVLKPSEFIAQQRLTQAMARHLTTEEEPKSVFQPSGLSQPPGPRYPPPSEP